MKLLIRYWQLTADRRIFIGWLREEEEQNNSISFGDLAIYCEKCESFVMKLTSDYCRSVAQTESARHGISEDDIRYWRKDDRIAFLHPYEKTETELRHTAELWMKIGYRDHIVTNEEIACTGCKPENWCRYQVVKCCPARWRNLI